MQINPVIEKDLKTKMRGWKAPALITLYLGFLGIVTFFFFLTSNQLSQYNMQSFNPRVALSAFNTLALFQFIMILFITPAMVGGTISGERERQTLDLLLCTNFSSFSVILGKIVVSIAHVILLIAASLPIMGIVFLFGGIRFTDLLLLFAFYVLTAVMIGSIGIFYSTLFRKSAVSIIVTYVTLLFFTVGTPILFAVWGYFIMHLNTQPTLTQAMSFMFPNPMFGYFSLTEYTNAGNGGFFDLFRIGMYRIAGTPPLLKPWMVNMIFDVVISAIFILLSVWKIKPVKRSLFRRRKPVTASSEIINVKE